MSIRKKYLDKHMYSIWQGSDGKWCTYLPDKTKKNNRVFIKRVTQKAIEDAVINFWKSEEDNPIVDEVFTEWNDSRLEKRQIKESTHTRNKECYDRFYVTFGKRKIKSISNIEWEDFLSGCISQYNLSRKSFANLKTVTKGFLKRARKRGIISMDVEHFFIELDVSDNDFSRKIVNEEDEVFYDDEMDKIMKYTEDDPCQKNVAVALMFVTGLRVGEVVALKHEDFDGTTFQVKRTATRYRKDGKYFFEISEFPKTPAGYRRVFIPSSQQWIIDRMKSFNTSGEYIFVDKNGDAMKTDMIKKRLALICRNVNIPVRSPHKIRKTYASILLDNNVDQKTITSQMGHTNISCTENFYHRNRRRDAERQRIFDKIKEFA